MLNRLLFILTLALALSLAAVVAILPQFPEFVADNSLAKLFAADLVIRRAAIACAIGLLVSAFVFFRAANGERAHVEK